MKLVNTNNLSNIAEENELGHFYDDLKDENRSPCYQVNVNKERNEFVFLVDGKEIYSNPLSDFNLDYNSVMSIIVPALRIMKSGTVKDLKQFLKEKSLNATK